MSIMSIERWRDLAKEYAEEAMYFPANDRNEFIREEGSLCAEGLLDAAKVLGIDDVCKIVEDMAASFDCIEEVIGNRRTKSDHDFLIKCHDTANWLKDYIRQAMTPTTDARK